MNKVRVLVGTKKGAFILTSDGLRKDWKVDGPLFGGWEMYHLKGSPVNPDRIYASQTSGWFGQVIQRSDDGGRTWATPDGVAPPVPGEMPHGRSNRFLYEAPVGTHQWYDGTPHPWEFKRVWHLEPSLSDPDVGRSIPAIRFSSVVFPLPDGPMRATNRPALIERSSSCSGVIVAAPLR